MTNIFYPTEYIGNVGLSNTSNYPIGTGSGAAISSENRAQITWRTAGTFSNIYFNIIANGITATSTYKFRKGLVDGNGSISIGSGVTGQLSDSVNTDVIAAGDQINTQLITGASGTTITRGVHSIQFAPTTTTNTVNKLYSSGPISDTTALTTYYNALSGTNGLNTTEANSQYKNKTAATLQNLYLFVTANTASVATLTSRIGGVNGNLTISIGSGSTGIFEDTSHTDSLTSGNLINTAFNATTATTITIVMIAVDYLTTSNITQYLTSYTAGANVSVSQTGYLAVGGILTSFDTTEANQQCSPGIGFTASNLQGYVSSNANTGTTVITFRVATANGNQTVSYGSGVTGYLEDSTHSDVITSSQQIDYKIAAGGTGGAITFTMLGILATYTAPVSLLNWFPDYVATVLASALTARYSSTVAQVLSSPITLTQWKPNYEAVVPLPLKAAKHSYFSQKLASPIGITNWYPNYDARVSPASLNAKYTYVGQRLPSTILINQWTPNYEATIPLLPLTAKYSYFSQLLSAPLSFNNWYPAYYSEVSPSPLNSRYSYVSQLLDSPLGIFQWFPDYDADVTLRPLISQGYVSNPTPNIPTINFYPVYDSAVKPYSTSSRNTYVAFQQQGPLVFNQWYPNYSAEVKASPTGSKYSYFSQTLSSPASIISFYPAYDAQVTLGKPNSKNSYYGQVLAAPLGIVNWTPTYDATVAPYKTNTKNSYYGQSLLAPLRVTNWAALYDPKVKATPLAAPYSSIAQLLNSPISILSWPPTYNSSVVPPVLAAKYSYFSQLLSSPVAILQWLPDYDAQVEPSQQTAKFSSVTQSPVQPTAFSTIKWYPIVDSVLKKRIGSYTESYITTYNPLIIRRTIIYFFDPGDLFNIIQ